MYELRVISGFHRGATLPLDDKSHIIGANDGADVVLIDSSIAEHHATLHRTASGWSLAATGGSIYTANKLKSQEIIDLVLGNFVLVGDVWLAIVEQDAPWTEPSQKVIDASKTTISKKSNDARIFKDSEQSDSAAVKPTQEEASAYAYRATHRRGLKFVFAPFAIVAVLSAAAAYAMTVKSSSQHQIPNGVAASAKNLSEASLPQEQLREVFRKRLADAELLKQFELNLKDKSWTMSANLDDEETKRFERVLHGFMQEFNVTFPFNADISSAESTLPFKIRSVVSGANASLITQEGRRIFVGEEYRGVRLVAISNSRLVFAGKRKIEMDW